MSGRHHEGCDDYFGDEPLDALGHVLWGSVRPNFVSAPPGSEIAGSPL